LLGCSFLPFPPKAKQSVKLLLSCQYTGRACHAKRDEIPILPSPLFSSAVQSGTRLASEFLIKQQWFSPGAKRSNAGKHESNLQILSS
jgi:hypothetical protein